MIPLLTGAEIALIAAALVAIAAVLAALYQLGRLVYQWYWSRNPPAPTQDGIDAIQKLQAELTALGTPDAARPDKAKCKELWDLYDRAVAGNISAFALNANRAALEAICGRQ